MTASSEKSVEELREESERTREALTTTVMELRGRVGDTASHIKTITSPAHIKQEIRDYVRQERESLVESVQRKARENPLQLAAVAAAVAYPALGLLRALPAPLWLIGAGLFLTSKRGRRIAEDVRARADDAVQQGSERINDLAGSLRSDLEDRVAGARYGLEQTGDAVTSAVGGMTDRARAAVHDARDAVGGVVRETTSKASAAADRLGSKVSDTTETAKERVKGAGRTSRDAAVDFVSDNLFLVAGIAVAAGAIIAASIPPSDAENRLFGAGSGKLKDKAREAAAQGIEKVGDVAAEAAGSVASAAAREGLDAAGVQDALKKVADSVRTVADRGLDKALGHEPRPEANSDAPSSSGERSPA